MRAPPALLPLRHSTYRALWTGNLVTALGTWMQNTGAGWLMTSLAPNPLAVSLVQAATIVPTFLLALPAGALADIVDRRRLMVGVQIWTMLAAAVLAVLTYQGLISAAGLIALTFAIGIGTAMYQPAWGATVPEVVPRDDLVPAIALNGIGFNVARSLGPALGGVLVVFGGPALTFALFAASFLVSAAVLFGWRRERRRSSLPREKLLEAMRVGLRFVRHSPGMRAAILRVVAFSLPAAAPWALLPLIVREQLGLGAGSFGLLLGIMGVGGVTSGMVLPLLHGRTRRGTVALGASLLAALGMALLAAAQHWALAGAGMLLFGIGWVASMTTTQAAAQIIAPPWVRARSLAVYQLTFNGALTLGSFLWGWTGSAFGLQPAMAGAAGAAAVLALLVRGWGLEASMSERKAPSSLFPQPEAPAPEIEPVLASTQGRVLEMLRYKVPANGRGAFLSLMAEVRRVRGRSGAEFWHLCEDVAHPEAWTEMWTMHDWADHLREDARLSADDRHVLAQAGAFLDRDTPAPSRYLLVDPALPTALAETRNGR